MTVSRESQPWSLPPGTMFCPLLCDRSRKGHSDGDVLPTLGILHGAGCRSLLWWEHAGCRSVLALPPAQQSQPLALPLQR